MMHPRFMLFILPLTVAVSSQALPAEARLAWVQGRVEVEALDGKSRRGNKDAAVAEGETVRTRDDGGAIVELEDGSRIKLREGSVLRLSSFKAQPEGRKTLLELMAGAAFSKVSKLGAGDAFRMQVGTTIAGVRGTEFFTSFGAKPAAGNEADVWLCVREGLVEVKAADEKTVAVKAGEGIVAPGGKTVTAPKPYAWTKKLNWNMDPGKGEVRDRTRLDSLYRDPRETHYD